MSFLLKKVKNQPDRTGFTIQTVPVCLKKSAPNIVNDVLELRQEIFCTHREYLIRYKPSMEPKEAF